MKSLISKGVVCAALSLLVAFGTLAQDSRRDVQDRKSEHSPLEEWVMPQSGGSREATSGSQQGTVHVRNFETAQPYIETLQFYVKKYGMNLDAKRLEDAANFNKSGSSGSTSEGVSLSVSNRTHALSSTFVGIYPTYSVTVTLYRISQVPRTHITVTRIDQPSLDKPQP